MSKLSFKISFILLTTAVIAVSGFFIADNVLAYGKDGVNLGQFLTKTTPYNTSSDLNKISSQSNDVKSFPLDSTIIKIGKVGLEKSQQITAPFKNYVEGEILVKYKNSKINLETISGRATASNFISSKSLENIGDIKKANISVLKIKDSKTVEQKIAELKNDPNIEYAEPNYKRYPAVINTNDTNRNLLWGLDNTGQLVNGVSGTSDADIDAPEAWAINEGTNSSIIVAVIDSGVAYNHPDLIANMWDGASCVKEDGTPLGGCNHGYDYEDGDKTPLPTTSSHGTHIAGTIAAAIDNGKGIIGVAPKAKIMAIKFGGDIASEIKAINFAIQNGAKVINASFVGADFSQLEYDAINSFKNAGGIFVAAAGNDATNNESTHNYPSDYNLSNIISVAATDQKDALASFSNYGATSVDVGAPGTNIYSTVPSVGDTNQLNESFEGVTQFSMPTNWVQNGSWGVYDRTSDWGSAWGKVLYGDLNYPYLSNSSTTATVPTINLSGATAGFVDFWTVCDTEYSTTNWTDYMQLEYSADGVTFFPATDPYFGGDFMWDEPTLDVLSGESPLNSTGWSLFHYENVSIPNQYLTSNFKLRFHWVTNASDNSYDGCVVDDVKVVKRVVSNGSDEQYDYSDGTSMATPHVAGLVALIEGYNPNLTSSQVKSIILTTGDIKASLSGTVSGKRVNAQSALQAVNPAKAITAFSFATPAVTGTIDETAKTVALTVPFGTSKTALVATFVTTGSSVKVGATTQISGTTANDFTSPVTYTVTAADASTQAYVVTVSTSVNPDIAFVAADKAALVDGLIQGTNPDLANITTTLANPLPASGSNGSTIAWVSSNTAVVSNNGQTVVRPAFGAGNATVTLTATLTKGVVTDTKVFTLTVLAETINPDIAFVAADKGALVDNSIKGANIDLSNITVAMTNPLPSLGTNGSAITWVSNTPAIVSNDGQTINRPAFASGNAAVTLTATLTKGVVTDTKVFILTVLKLLASADATITSATYTVGSDTITNVPFGTSKAIFLAALIKGESNQAWDNTGISDPVVTGNTLVVTAQDGLTTVAYTVTANPAPDTTAPVITLLGDNPINLYLGDPYTDAGASALDDVDGDITANIIVVNPADTSVIGTYTVTYNVSDTAGNPATEITRMVNVSGTPDTTAPVIDFHLDVNTDNDLGQAGAVVGYTLPTVTDDVDDSVVAICNPLPGTFFPIGETVITCDATDEAGNPAIQTSFKIIVADAEAPGITLLGENPVNLYVGDTYVNAGATASDNLDGDITANIVVGGDTVDTNTVGTYIITYNVSDAAGNPATEAIRTVNVASVPVTLQSIAITHPADKLIYFTGELLDLTGLEVIGTYSDASVQVEIITEANVTGFDSSIPATGQVLTITVDGKTTTYTIDIVFAPDTTAPVIVLNGSDPMTVEIGSIFTDPGATASDNVDGDITSLIVVSGSVDTSVINEYFLTYNVSDAAGNPAIEVIRTINVVDSTPPVITLLGDNPVNLYIGDTYNDAGATASDEVDGDVTANIITTGLPIDTVAVGTFTVTYNVSDTVGNSAELVRTVNVVDISTPIITLLGDNPITIEIGSEYVDAGATASDDADGDITSSIIVVNSVDSNILGVYTVTYNVTDSSDNHAPEAIRTVNVVDTTAPIITLTGDNPAQVEVGYEYVDAGATASDNYDGDITSDIIPTSNVNYHTVGTYTVNYNVTDSSGNSAEQVSRTVIVGPDLTPPIIILTGDTTINLTIDQTYTELGATATDNADGDLTSSIIVVGSVDSAIIGTYYVTYNVTDAAGNPAVEVVRTVDVVVAPVTLSSIAITTPATKLSYTVGNVLDITGLVVTGTYSDASTKVETITTANVTGFDSSAPATDQVLTITVGGKTTTYTVNIVAAPAPTGGGGYYIPPTNKPGDFNGDGKVDKYDFALMMASWGKTGTNVCDFNSDGKVDKYDFALLMSKWGL